MYDGVADLYDGSGSATRGRARCFAPIPVRDGARASSTSGRTDPSGPGSVGVLRCIGWGVQAWAPRRLPLMAGAESTTSSIYIASPEGDTGRSTITLGVLHLVSASPGRVGIFRPVAHSTDQPDPILELILEHTTANLGYDRCVGVTYARVRENPEAALSEIVARYHQVQRECDTVVIIGSDYTDVVSPSELTFNARIAVNLGAPVLLAINAHGRTAEEVGQLAKVCLSELSAAHAHPV